MNNPPFWTLSPAIRIGLLEDAGMLAYFLHLGRYRLLGLEDAGMLALFQSCGRIERVRVEVDVLSCESLVSWDSCVMYTAGEYR